MMQSVCVKNDDYLKSYLLKNNRYQSGYSPISKKNKHNFIFYDWIILHILLLLIGHGQWVRWNFYQEKGRLLATSPQHQQISRRKFKTFHKP